MTRENIWTSHEIAQLKMMYEAGVLLGIISDKLSRSISAIKTRTQRLGFVRPKRFGARQVQELQAKLVESGFKPNGLPNNPTALRILLQLVGSTVLDRDELTKRCGVQRNTINKAIVLLHDAGLVYVETHVNPGRLVLKRTAFQNRPEPNFASGDQIRLGVLPTIEKLHDVLGSWLPEVTHDELSSDAMRAFVEKQWLMAKTGDVAAAEFYSIFYSA